MSRWERFLVYMSERPKHSRKDIFAWVMVFASWTHILGWYHVGHFHF